MSAINPQVYVGSPLGIGGGLVHSFINPQPITKRSIARYNPRIIDPYRGKRAADPMFVVYGPKPPGGSAIGTLYEKESRDPTRPRRKYLGKVGIGRGVFENDPRTYRRLTKAEMNIEAILEKIGYDLYQELGRGIFQVPKSYLSRQRILDQYTRTNRLALILAGTIEDVVGQGLPMDEATPIGQLLTNESLRIMCQMVEGYQDFEHGRTQEEGRAEESFIAYVERTHRPPEHLLTPKGRLVPIRGLIGLVAVARIIADTDVLGGSGGNAGFVWVRDETGQIIAAQAVKIDPGMAFQFERHGGVNWADNTYRRAGIRTLTDIRDLQVANNNDQVTFIWERLTATQKTEFLQVLYNSSRYLNSPDILDYLFYRDERFNRSEIEENPREIANRFREQMERWLNIQLEIYQTELREFKEKYQVQIACTQHIDQWAEFLVEQQQKLVESAVGELRVKLEETSRELSLSRLAQEAMSRDLSEKGRRLGEAEKSLQEAEQRLQVTERSLRLTSQGLEQMVRANGEMMGNLSLSSGEVVVIKGELEQVRAEGIRQREESQRRMEELMRRLEAIEARSIKVSSRSSRSSSSAGVSSDNRGAERYQPRMILNPVRTPRLLPTWATAASSSAPISPVEMSRGKQGAMGGNLSERRLRDAEKSLQEIERGLEQMERANEEIMANLTHEPAASSSAPISPVEMKVASKPTQAFGAEEWARYFGDIGLEPPLPPNIEEILASPCPFWSGKRLGETHLLVLIPVAVDGQLYTLNVLEQLILSPKAGGHKASYNLQWDALRLKLGREGLERSYWGLMTRDVVPGSRGKSLWEQENILKERTRGVAGISGGIPTVLEAATSVLVEHVRVGTRLYSDSPSTSTRCQEVVNGYQTVIGGFSVAGLYFCEDYSFNNYAKSSPALGVACFWKF